LLSHEGAFVGGWRTMVEAARIRTCGLGGDSEAKIDNRSMTKKIILGPRRAVPLSLLSMEHPELIAKMQDQLKQPIAQNSDGHFIIPMMADEPPDWLSRSEMALARKALDHKVIALDELASTQVALGAVNRLIRRGLLMMSAFTPTDASHVLGHFDRFNGPAARLGALLLARQKTASGTQLAPTAEQVSQMTLDALTLHSSVFILDTAFSEQGEAEGLISASPFLTASLDKTAEHPRKTASVSLKLDIPLIALGASAATYYPAVARYLDAELVIPPFSEVAGAVGAAAGGVRQRVVVLITQPSEGVFRLHLPEGLKDFPVLDQALRHGVEVASQLAENRAKAAGAKQVSLSLEEKIEEVPLGPDKTLFLQAIITANASGRPS